MGRIRLLPDEVAHKIAAGEVIERPASVVKELLENAIDAQASRVEVEITSGGIEYIRVQDNGEGIAPEDVPLAFQPHATSKIGTTEDLFNLHSLGFRGEALPSIASVSKLTLVTRTAHQDIGIRAEVVGEEMSLEPCGAPKGTTVEVRQLFYNVPARYKFLKSRAAESRRVLEVVTGIALAHPHIAFTCVRDGRTVLTTQGSGNLKDTLLLIHGKRVKDELLAINKSYAWGTVQGYAGTPKLGMGNRSGQLIVMNGRVIHNSAVRAAVEKGYQGLLPARTYPFFVVVLDVDPKFVDCNVHPAKSEVRFAEEQSVFRDVLDAVRSAILTKNIAPQIQAAPPRTAPAQPRRITPRPQQKEIAWEPATWEQLDAVLRKYRPGSETPEPPLAVREHAAAVVETASPDQHSDDVRSMLVNGRIIGQLHQMYILLEVMGGGMWILDQHIVHERVLYERFLRDFASQTLHVQQILPEVLEFSPAEYDLVQEYSQAISKLGIELEPFGGSTYIIRGVPTFLSQEGGWKDAVLEIAQKASTSGQFREEAAVTLACKAAVKAGDYLDMKAMQKLVAELANTENPFTCPHGRPIIIRLEQAELLRRFGRV
ncbi:MAG: DNA mismatch repair endonuclease MutL [Limnochordia bacterium]|jgi:DNA mismatch repair protein MutL